MSKIPLVFILVITGLFFIWLQVGAATTDHLVISQVQITGGPGKTTNDFVEIYNPTDQDIDLKGMRLVKRTKTGTSDTLLKSWTDSAIVKAHGYYLWANSAFTEITARPDVTTTGSLAADNGAALRSGPNDTGIIVDSLAWGEAANTFVEGTVFATDPEASQSLERKPGSGSGNGEDSNNNFQDFFLQTASHPRNQASTPEPPLTTPSPPPPPAGGESSGGPSTGSGSSSGFFELEISEIMPNPKGKDAGNEWVELYNAGTTPIDLSRWSIDDDGAEDIPSSNAFLIPDGTTLGGKSYIVIQVPKGKFALNNTGSDAVRLFDGSGILKLRQAYTGPVKEGYSFAKNTSNVWEWTENVTPGSSNSFAVLTVYSSSVRISEVLPNPEGDDAEGEFIEVFNFGNDSIDLTDWVIADERKRYIISEEDFADTEIGPGGFFAVYREISGISLNNSGKEVVKLINPLGEVVDEIIFDATSKEAEAYAWELDKIYRWTSFLTPGQKNKFVPVQDIGPSPLKKGEGEPKVEKNILEIPLSEIRNQELGTLITTSGIVAVEPGILGERVFYLQGSGIRVFLPENLSTELKLGMRVQLSGQLSSFHNELQLKVDESDGIQIFDEDSPIVIVSSEIETGAVGEEQEGLLVKIAGQVARSQGDTFYLDDGSGEARVYIRESTGIIKPKLKKGTEVEITGIVSQFNDIYRVMPRYQSDLVLAGVAGAINESRLPRTGVDFWPSVAFLLAFCYIIFTIIKRKENQNEQSGID